MMKEILVGIIAEIEKELQNLQERALSFMIFTTAAKGFSRRLL